MRLGHPACKCLRLDKMLPERGTRAFWVREGSPAPSLAGRGQVTTGHSPAGRLTGRGAVGGLPTLAPPDRHGGAGMQDGWGRGDKQALGCLTARSAWARPRGPQPPRGPVHTRGLSFRDVRPILVLW